MSNEKLKSERTALLGINSKASPYLVGPNEFQDIRNMDFQTPGALTQRWGSTQYIGQTFAGQINSLCEFQKLDGSSYVVTSHSGGIWYGATTGQYQGMSLTNLNATLGITMAFGQVAWSFIAGIVIIADSASYLGNPSNGIMFGYSGGPTEYLLPAVQSDNRLDCVTFQNRLYMADGNKFLKFDGATLYKVGLPFPALVGSINATGVLSLRATVSNAAAASFAGFGNATFASYAVYISYLNNAGLESQIWPIAYTANTLQTVASSLGGSFVRIQADVATPLGYGITAINVYTYATSASMTSNLASPGFTLWSPNYVLMGTYPSSGSTFTTIDLGTTRTNFANMIDNIGPLPDASVNRNYPLGGVTFVKESTTFTPLITSIKTLGGYPRYLELYKNRLFCAGFSAALSTVCYSNLADPEGYQLDNNFEVRTNDGDYITCLKAYSTRLYIFKKGSFEALYGDNPNNFYLQEISQNYGCLNNQCSVIYNDLLMFLDRNGAMQYNGSALSNISDKISPIFDRMNYVAAVDNACMAHDKLRNQVVIGIPVDGATLNNYTLAYDYLSGAWTIEQGFTPSVFARIKGYNNSKNLFYGTPSGTINWFGPSFLSDNGVGFTCSFKPSWFHDFGETVEKQFRDLYLNITPKGVTFTLPVNFYQDYGTSIVKSTTIVQSEFQTRTQYGIPARSLSFEIFSNQTATVFQVTAISTAQRMQRAK